MRFPDFYIVGAPKCGTTTIYDALGCHPQIFVPRPKELIFFGTDLSYSNRPSRTQYLAHFAPAPATARIGTAHTAYLQSRRAAAEIHADRPDARIVVMLRNPVEMLPSWHSELLYEAIEDIVDFDEALAAEAARRRGERVPKNAANSYVEALFYADVARFAEQLTRYIEVFGREQVFVGLLDDLKSDPARLMGKLLEFLDVDPTIPLDIVALNSNKRARSRRVAEVFFHSPRAARRIARRALPKRLRRRLIALNTSYESRAQISVETRQQLIACFRDDISRLSDILERDLSAWVTS